MKTTNLIISITIAILLTIVSGCGKKQSGSETNENSDEEFATYDEKTNIITVDLKDNFDKEDSFDGSHFLGQNYAMSDPLRIKIITDAKIVKAEKIVCYYPTVWARPNDEAIQFIYLYDLEYKDVMPLEINDGIIEYPLSGFGSETAYRNFFGNITKSQILSSVENVPSEYERKGSGLLYYMNSWESEVSVWKNISAGYKPGELTDDDNEPFDVDKCEIELVVTFKGANGQFTKTFCDQAIIGN